MAAPKRIGRMLGQLYQAEGRAVYRFAHRGERAFFDDDHWGLSELSFCDLYVTHSKGEAASLQRRLDDGRLIHLGQSKPRFAGLGSKAHQALFVRARRTADSYRRARRGRTSTAC